MLFAMFSAQRNPDSGRQATLLGQKEFKEDREETHPYRQYPPQQTLPGSGNSVRFNLVSGRNIFFRPRGNLSVVERLDFSPSYKSQQGLVVWVVYKNVFQAVAIGVLEHGTERSH